MKFWRPGITGKLFVAIFATCIVLLITMHWAVRLSFERGFIDYIKHGNEQRLQGLSDALAEQYTLHGNWRFLRNNDRFVFQILRSLEHGLLWPLPAFWLYQQARPEPGNLYQRLPLGI